MSMALPHFTSSAWISRATYRQIHHAAHSNYYSILKPAIMVSLSRLYLSRLIVQICFSEDWLHRQSFLSFSKLRFRIWSYLYIHRCEIQDTGSHFHHALFHTCSLVSGILAITFCIHASLSCLSYKGIHLFRAPWDRNSSLHRILSR